ncbi:MAG: phospho-sugar mutase [Eubacteriales bacterium]|nr:phospho-sugar mutase [Eubacteriales bacterium]
MNAFDIYNIWKEKVTDPSLRSELESIDGNENEIVARFTAPMSFGTAGLRSIMGAGISRMNIYTVAQATQGLAELIRQENAADKGVAIAHDSRNNSRLFAEISARVLAANGITVYLFDSLRPTPELSFAILELGCISGINITASHNPKEYNGYKVYWSDGAQLPPEHAAVVCEKIAGCDMFSVPMAELSDKHIHVIGSEIDEKYIDAVLGCVIDRDALKEFGNSLNLVYTPLHGTGYRLVPEAMRRAGISNLTVIPEQAVPDGNFPTVASPNPENKPCFKMALDYIEQHNMPTDVVVATDPDGDRLGVAVKKPSGEFIALSGNQIGALLVSYIIAARRSIGRLPENACAIRSVVSSPLFDTICRDNGVEPVCVLTGFKYIGEKIKEYAVDGSHTFIFGYEESQGFLSGGYVRDKDGVAAALLIAEAASHYKSFGKSLYEALYDIYDKYGWAKETILNIKIEGALPMQEMSAKMAALRASPFKTICGTDVVRIRDYAAGTVRDIKTGAVTSTGLPKSDMLFFELSDGSNVIIRPSGTEPKIKIYIQANGADSVEVDQKLDTLAAFKYFG